MDSSPAEFERLSMAFMSWLSLVPGFQVSAKIALADLRSENQGRAVVAKADIEEDELLFSIPRSALLTVENSGIEEKIPEIKQLDPWIGIIVTMLAESAENSRWKPYFGKKCVLQVTNRE